MSKAAHHGRVTSNLSQSRFTPSKPRPAALAPAGCGFSPPDRTESLTNGRLREYQGMALRLVQFLAIMLTALALVPSGAHLAALPNKMALAQAAYWIRKRPVA